MALEPKREVGILSTIASENCCCLRSFLSWNAFPYLAGSKLYKASFQSYSEWILTMKKNVNFYSVQVQ